MELGRQSVYLPTEGIPATELRSLVQTLEQLGYSAVWIPEDHGREPLVTAALILEHTRTLQVATGVLDVQGRDPLSVAMGQQTLVELSGGRFVLGLGLFDRRGPSTLDRHQRAPVQRLREYLALLRQAHTEISVTRSLALEGPAPQSVTHGTDGAITTALGELPIVLGALGPRLVALAGEMAQGVHTLNASPAHTRWVRERLGPGPWVCPVQRVCLIGEPRRARALGRQAVATSLALPAFRAALLRDGFAQDDFEYGGSDRLIDQLLAFGERSLLRARVREHFDAGASQVCLHALRADDPSRPCLRTLEALSL